MSRVLLESGDVLLLESGDDLLLEDVLVEGGNGGEPQPEPPPAPPLPAGKWLVLARIFLDSGTENAAGKRVTHPSWEYEARVLSAGQIDRSIPTPAGMPQVGDARVRTADTDRRSRNLLARQTARQRVMQLKLVQEGTSESAQEPIFTGAIVNIEFGPGYIDWELRDKSFAWLDEEIPNFINRTNFPNLAEGIDEAFLPIIAGINVSLASNPVGVIPLPHIGWDGTKDRWGVAAHPVYRVRNVYRKREAGSPLTTTWDVVSPSEYTVTEEAMEFAEVPDVDFNPTFLDFNTEQPSGTEIRIDADGMDFRGGWEGIPPAGYDATDNPSGTPGPLRNPVDVFINFIFLMMRKAGVTADTWEVSTIEETLEKFSGQYTSESNYAAQLGSLELGQAELGDSGASATFPAFFVDGVLIESMTLRALLGRFLPSFELNFYQQKNGKLALTYTEETDEDRPVFDDISHILRNSLFERLASPTINRMIFRYQHNYATDEWGISQIQDNEADQDALGILEEDVFDMDWVRDPTTAAYVAARRMSFLALGAYRQSFTLPLPEVFEDIELAKLVGLTHWGGADYEGYLNKEVKIIGLTMDLDRLTVKVDSILRVPQAMVAPPEDAVLVAEACDDFNRATLGSNWTADQRVDGNGYRLVADISANELRFSKNGFNNTISPIASTALIYEPHREALAGQRQYAEFTWKWFLNYTGGQDIAEANYIGAFVMVQGSMATSNLRAYGVEVEFKIGSLLDGHTEIVRLVRIGPPNGHGFDAGLTQALSADFAVTNGDRLRIEAIPGDDENQLILKKNGATLFTTTDDSEYRVPVGGSTAMICRHARFWNGIIVEMHADDFCSGTLQQPPAGDEFWDDFDHAADAETIEGLAHSGEFSWVTPVRSDGDFAPWKIRLGASLTRRVLQATSGSTDPVNWNVAEDYNFLAVCPETVGADQWAEMVYDAEPQHANAASGPAVRIGGSTWPTMTGYSLRLRVRSNRYWFLELVRLYEDPSAADGILHTVLASVELARYPAWAALAHGDVLRIEVQGTTLRGYLNGVERLSVTDANLSSGSIGMSVNAFGNRTNWIKWSYWRGGEL